VKVGVIGSRSVTAFDFGRIGLEKGDTVVTGGAKGVDALAGDWAWRNGYDVDVRLPDYRRYGRAAPHVRNDEIIRASDRLVAVWDGQSRGTRSVIEKCRKNGKEVTVYDMR
jgi:hypothetical protein